MNRNERYVFEITYDVRDDCREEYETWLSTTTIAWLSSDALCGFHSEQSVAPDSSEVRLLLEFDTLGEWLAFVNTTSHQERLLRLGDLTDELHAHLWEPTAVLLTPTADGRLVS